MRYHQKTSMFEIRKATLADIAIIHDLASVAFPATYRTILTAEQIEYMMEWMYAPASLRRQMTDEGHLYFIAFDGATAAGYVSIQQESTHLFHLQKIYVLPHYQGHGLGRMLFDYAVATIHTLHPAPCRMELNVNRLNPAIHFYERMGLRVLRSGDFDIGGGYYMRDHIMGIDIDGTPDASCRADTKGKNDTESANTPVIE